MAARLDHSVLVTTSVAGEQVIHSTTIAGTDFLIKFMSLGASYTTYNATEAYLGFGRIQFDTGSGWETKDRSPAFVNTDLDTNSPLIVRPLGVGQTLVVGHSVRAVANPATATSIRWRASFWGTN